MMVSARCDYACKAILELALYWPNTIPMQIHTISERQNIPIKYLPQVLIQLRNMGIVKSVRGKEGGYVLAKSPGEIKLIDIIKRISGPILQVSDSVSNNGSVLKDVWEEIELSIIDVLSKRTFEDIVKQVKKFNHKFMYQI